MSDALVVDGFVEVGFAGFPDQLACQRQGDGRAGCQLLGHFQSRGHQLVILNDAIDHAPFQRFFRRDLIAEQRHFHCAHAADRAGQKPRRSAIWYEAYAAEGLKEIGALGANHDVANKCE